MKIFSKRGGLLQLLLILAVTIAQAQNMKVVGFAELVNDLTANRHGTSMTDENGETAALIKIVTSETGFSFDGGSLGIVGVVQKQGEIWLYVPARAQRLTISHRDFGVLRNYAYSVPIEGAKTYEMLLDIGTGCYATITSPVARSKVYIDNTLEGTVPLYNKYLNYGKHVIRVVNDKLEGTVERVITSGMKSVNIDVELTDMSHLYGDVRVLVENNADIIFGGEKVANGIWDTQLKEGTYVIETHKENYEDSKTSFTVVAQQKNEITAIAPSPYTGYLSVYTRPQAVSVIDSRGKYIDLSEQTPLLVGSHQFSFQKKDYVSQTKEYTVTRNQVVKDTIELQPIEYFKKFAFYFGAGFTVRSISGFTGVLGVTYFHHDLQLSYTFGTGKSDEVNIYDTNWNYLGKQKYGMNSMAVKYGYLIDLTRKFALVPQVGYMQNSISSTVVEGSQMFADGASCKCVTIGLKALLVPMKHVYLFAAPEYAIASGKDASFDLVATQSNIGLGGFAATIGVMATF